MYAVRRSAPPKQMFVVSGSPVAQVLDRAPSGEIDVMPPLTKRRDAHPAVAVDGERVEELEARRGRRAARHRRAQRVGPCDDPRRRHVPRPHPPGVGLGGVEAVPSGDRPMPFGESIGKTTSLIDDPSGLA